MVDQFDLLVDTLGGVVSTPRQVFDDQDDVDTPGALVSEIGDSERHYRRRSAREPEATEKWSRFRALRQREDIEILDLTEEEEGPYEELRSSRFARRHDLAVSLGPGEAAVIAIAEERGMRAVMDEHAGRSILRERSPGHNILTTRDVLRIAATDGHISSPEAEIVYGDMRAEGYRGPDALWS